MGYSVLSYVGNIQILALEEPNIKINQCVKNEVNNIFYTLMNPNIGLINFFCFITFLGQVFGLYCQEREGLSV